MTARNKAVGEWHVIRTAHIERYWADEDKPATITIEQADMLDTKLNHRYMGGAFRVLRDGKPIRGKGGSVPHLGETAWCAADRTFDDLIWTVQREGADR